VTDLLQRTPLRVKLVAAVVALAALGLTVSGAAATTALRGYLLDRVDAQLAAAVNDPRQLNALLRGSGDGDGRPDSFGSIYVQFGQSATALPDAVPPPAIPAKTRPDGNPFTVPATRGGTSWRVVEGNLATPSGSGVIVIAVPLDEVQRTVRRLVRIETVVGLIVLLLLAGGGYVVVRRSLRPLVEVETAAEAVAAGDLTRRVPEADPRTEVGSLSRSFNTMVTQVESAFAAASTSEADARASEERMRRFVGDASHELRTPLTSIRGFAELYRQGALPAPEDVSRAMSRVESEASRMGLLVEDLLLLARLDQQRPLERARVDLLQLAGDAVQDARAVDPARRVDLQVVPGGPAPVVLGDAARLRQVLGNLVSNALTHTPAGSAVGLRVSTAEHDALVAVIDHGPGIAAEDRSRIFERFFRADTSRARASGGTGLGLSIVSALVAAHGGAVSVEQTPGGGATFTLRLPLA
jgi:two-component system OmpR family sensor kinase